MTPDDELLKKHRVFIVDDHSVFLHSLEIALNAQPHLQVVGRAKSAEDALPTFVAATPDLLLVDYSLPHMNGAEFVEHVKRKHPALPCLMMSSWTGRHINQAALGAGATEYISKGNPQELFDAIDRALR